METTLPLSGHRSASRDDRFFLISAVLMTALVFGAFSMQLGMGRSSFAVPILYHLHAVVFMGWVVLYLLQTAFATTGHLGLHRTFGWIAAVWVVPMVVLGPLLTVDRVQAARVPFFFLPQHFLIANPLGIVAFVGLTVAAIVLRRRTDWHRRLHYCGMSALLGPAFGRLLPMPLMEPVAFQSAVVAGLAFPIAGMIADARRGRGVHPAWLWGIGAIVGTLMLAEVLARSPIGDAIYAAVTTGSPGAAVAPMEYGPRPPGFPPRT